MKDETLLPCPFCGSNECEAFAQDEDDCPYQSAIVRCFNCDAQSAQMVGKDKISRAIAAWNKRPTIQSGNSGQVPAGYVLVPVEPTPEMLTASYLFAHVDNTKDSWKAMLAAAPAAPDGWIPVSERMPVKLWCRTCRPITLNDMRFVVCPDCGNKRCPKANDHRNACTGSNEPGQEGSAYPDAPKGV